MYLYCLKGIILLMWVFSIEWFCIGRIFSLNILKFFVDWENNILLLVFFGRLNMLILFVDWEKYYAFVNVLEYFYVYCILSDE